VSDAKRFTVRDLMTLTLSMHSQFVDASEYESLANEVMEQRRLRDDDDYADVVKDDSGDWVQASDYDALAARLAGELEHERDACSQLARGAVIRAEAAEARVRELEHALRRASERLSWLRDHHCSSDFARGQAKMAADECWRVQAGERAAASARAVQEPACQHDLQQSAPTVRVWHSIFEPEKQSAECNVCGSRWTLNGVGRG